MSEETSESANKELPMDEDQEKKPKQIPLNPFVQKLKPTKWDIFIVSSKILSVH